MAAIYCGNEPDDMRKNSFKKQKLFDDDDEEVNKLRVNSIYAKKYSKWRKKEEYEKLKARFGTEENDEDSSDSSDDFDDETESKFQLEFDKQFYNTLACLRSKDSKIYDESVQFFSDDMNFDNAPSTSKKKTKPMYLHDHERELLLATNGELPDEEEENRKQMQSMMKKKRSLTYVEEQKKLKDSFKDALADSDDDELFTGVKEHTNEEDEPQAEASLMKDEALAETIRNIWKDDSEDLDDNDKFLRDYFVQKKYAVHDIEHENHKDEEIDSDEINSFSKQQELFEHKYNFRFEEPDQEFIKRYPRTMNNLLRRKDTSRKEKRLEIRERKNAEKLKKREEIKRLKALKKKEILDRLKTIQNVTGNAKVGFNEIDLDEEFDPEDHDKRMREMFDNDYYGVEEEERPVFPEDEELDGNENWDDWDPNNDASYSNKGNENWDDWDPNNDASYSNNEPHCEDPDFNMDCDYDPRAALRQELISSSKKSKLKKGKLAKALLRKKPVFDPSDKSFEEYFDEYFKLDYEDNIGDLLCRFKYRKVIPNDFGLDTEEILAADDKELNRWCSLRKTCQHRTEDEEKYDVQAYKKKASNINKKIHILKSVYQKDEPEETGKQNELEANEPEETDTVLSQGEINTGKRKRKRKKQAPTPVDASDITTTEPGENEIEEQPAKTNAKKQKKKWKNNYELEATIPDSRLKAYNINPKKFKNKLKYSKQNLCMQE